MAAFLPLAAIFFACKFYKMNVCAAASNTKVTRSISLNHPGKCLGAFFVCTAFNKINQPHRNEKGSVEALPFLILLNFRIT